MFQTLIVFLVVAFAAIYLANKLLRQFFSKSESCEGCAIGKSSNSVDLKNPY